MNRTAGARCRVVSGVSLKTPGRPSRNAAAPRNRSRGQALAVAAGLGEPEPLAAAHAPVADRDDPHNPVRRKSCQIRSVLVQLVTSDKWERAACSETALSTLLLPCCRFLPPCSGPFCSLFAAFAAPVTARGNPLTFLVFCSDFARHAGAAEDCYSG
jgi:hypothetical protein